jgi:hypothetical protein
MRCQPAKQIGCNSGENIECRSLAELVSDYRKRYRAGASDELAFFRKRASFGSAVNLAARAENWRGMRFDHQRRIKRVAIAGAQKILRQHSATLEKCRSFDELHIKTTRLLRPIFGIGPLYIYDTALRLGAYLDFAPTKVYLHAGTLDGARRLALPFVGRQLEVDVLPKVLRQLSPSELEDFLCIYKACFQPIGTQEDV